MEGGIAQRVPAGTAIESSATVAAVNSGPLGQSAGPATVPGPGGKMVPFNPLHDTAFDALDLDHRTGYVVCDAAAALSSVLAGIALGGIRHSTEPVAEPAADAHPRTRVAGS